MKIKVPSGPLVVPVMRHVSTVSSRVRTTGSIWNVYLYVYIILIAYLENTLTIRLFDKLIVASTIHPTMILKYRYIISSTVYVFWISSVVFTYILFLKSGLLYCVNDPFKKYNVTIHSGNFILLHLQS